MSERIDANVIEKAAIIANKVDDSSLRKRTLVLNVASELACNILNKLGVDVSAANSLHRIPEIAKELEFSDIYVNNIRLDVRVTFDDKNFCIPKSQEKYGVLPSAYVVLKLDKNLFSYDVLGFVPSSDLQFEKNSSNYHLFESSLLKPLEELNQFLSGVKEEVPVFAFSEHSKVKELVPSFLSGEISESEKIYFIQHAILCPVCREVITDFNGFEKISLSLKNYPELLNDSTLSVLSGNKIEIEQVKNLELLDLEDKDLYVNESDDDIQSTLISSDLLVDDSEKTDVDITLENQDEEFVDDSDLNVESIEGIDSESVEDYQDYTLEPSEEVVEEEAIEDSLIAELDEQSTNEDLSSVSNDLVSDVSEEQELSEIDSLEDELEKAEDTQDSLLEDTSLLESETLEVQDDLSDLVDDVKEDDLTEDALDENVIDENSEKDSDFEITDTDLVAEEVETPVEETLEILEEQSEIENELDEAFELEDVQENIDEEAVSADENDDLNLSDDTSLVEENESLVDESNISIEENEVEFSEQEPTLLGEDDELLSLDEHLDATDDNVSESLLEDENDMLVEDVEVEGSLLEADSVKDEEFIASEISSDEIIDSAEDDVLIEESDSEIEELEDNEPLSIFDSQQSDIDSFMQESSVNEIEELEEEQGIQVDSIEEIEDIEPLEPQDSDEIVSESQDSEQLEEVVDEDMVISDEILPVNEEPLVENGLDNLEEVHIEEDSDGLLLDSSNEDILGDSDISQEQSVIEEQFAQDDEQLIEETQEIVEEEPALAIEEASLQGEEQVDEEEQLTVSSAQPDEDETKVESVEQSSEDELQQDMDPELKELLDDDLMALLSENDDNEDVDNSTQLDESQTVSQEYATVNEVEDVQQEQSAPSPQEPPQEESIETLFEDGGQETVESRDIPGAGIVMGESSSNSNDGFVKKLITIGLLLILAAGGGGFAWFMSQNKTANTENDAALDSANQSDSLFDMQNAENSNAPQQAAVPQDINKSMANSFSDKPTAITVTKISWQVSEKLAADNSVKEYLQTAGKNIQMNLQNDLSTVADVAFNNSVKISIVIAPDNTLKGTQVLESSGSDKVDEAIQRSIKNTLKYVNVPKIKDFNSDYFFTIVINF